MTRGNLYEEVIIAGFGGQGIVLAGRLLAQTAMEAGKEVTYMPSYGAEVRGGTANSMVIISDEPIASPLISRPNSLIAMNKASLGKFAPRVKENGILIMNSSLIDEKPQLCDTIDIVEVPADDIAVDKGSVRIANMVALGAYLGRTGLFDVEQMASALPQVLAERYHNMLSINIEALKKGAEVAKAAKV